MWTFDTIAKKKKKAWYVLFWTDVPFSHVQVFSYTANKEIRTDDLCLDVSKLNGPVMMLKCHHLKGNQLWEYDPVVSGMDFAQPNHKIPNWEPKYEIASELFELWFIYMLV